MHRAANTQADQPARAADRAHAAFLSRFGVTPAHTAKAPGRINIIGEHTDYNGGLVLPAPIGLHTVLAAGPAPSSLSQVVAVDLGDAFTFDQSKDLAGYFTPGTAVAPGHWASYILGVLHGYKERGYHIPALNMAVASEIPIGSGLSSSAALEAATANLIESICGRSIGSLEKARLCRAAEHTFAGVPCGLMDQYAVIRGRPGHALLIDCSEETAEDVALPPPDSAAILVVDTQVRHKLADGAYAQRRAVCASAAGRLGVSLLSQADIASLRQVTLSDDEFRCATHVLLENARVRLAAECLRRGDVQGLGQLLYESHASLRHDFRVSCAELDTVVDVARTTHGVYGARMTGAGFGGCAIVLLAPASLPAASRAIQEGFLKAFGRPCAPFLASGR